MAAASQMSSYDSVTLEGEAFCMPVFWPVRALLIVSGMILIRDILSLAARYCLGLRKKGVASARDGVITVTMEWTLLGRRFLRSKTSSPARGLGAVRFENRQRYLYLLVGLGALVAGTFVGMQFLLDGLRAGYPYLVLLGAGIVAAGVLLDIAVYLLVPRGEGKSHMLLALGPWFIRLKGVDATRAEAFLEAAIVGWKK